MKRAWIGAAAAVAIAVGAGYAGAQEKQPGQDQARAMQKDQDLPPGADNMDKRGERDQSAAPMNESQRQKPADRAPGESGAK